MRPIAEFLRAHWLAVGWMAGIGWFLTLRIYYLIKPVLPKLLRLPVRRWLARRERARCARRWPILESAGVMPKDWPGWPEGRKFAFVLTHDVESQRGLERVKLLAELEMSLGFRSTFNFIPEGPYRVTSELREWLVAAGFEVGVHDHRHDGKLYNSRASFRQAAARINHYLAEWGAVGFRSGFMFHNLEWIKELNIRYDASTFDTDPFEPQSDGANTIFPFWVPISDGRGFVELPYTLVQDSTLFVMLREKSCDIWKQKLTWIRRRRGMALLNVHPDYMSFAGVTAEDEFPVTRYTEFLTWVKERHFGQYWPTTARGVADFYRHDVAGDRCVQDSQPFHEQPRRRGGRTGA